MAKACDIEARDLGLRDEDREIIDQKIKESRWYQEKNGNEKNKNAAYRDATDTLAKHMAQGEWMKAKSMVVKEKLIHGDLSLDDMLLQTESQKSVYAAKNYMDHLLYTKEIDDLAKQVGDQGKESDLSDGSPLHSLMQKNTQVCARSSQGVWY